VVICLKLGAELHITQMMPLPLTVSSVKSRLVLPFWYWLTQAVPVKRPLNGCVCVCVSCCYWILEPSVSEFVDRLKCSAEWRTCFYLVGYMFSVALCCR